MIERLITFGESTIGLVYEGGRSAEIIDFLFKRIPTMPTGEPWTVLRLEDHGPLGGLLLWQDETILVREHSPSKMAEAVMSQVCFTLAYESRQGFLLHSAAIQSLGKGVILPGKTGAGKSMLTAWLISHDCHYLTDEIVFIPLETEDVRGFARPLTIKAEARYLLPNLLKDCRSPDGIVSNDLLDMIDPETFGANVVSEPIPLDLIVFPHYQADQGLEMEQLSPAQTAYELMKCLANARNLSDHGFSEAVRLAKMTPAYSIKYCDSTNSGLAILSLLNQA